MTAYGAFVGLAIVLVAVPGPAVVLVSTSAARRGARAAAATALGVFVADLVWMVASLVGLTAVLVASEPAFLAIRYVGAAYLVLIGLRLLAGHEAVGCPAALAPPAPQGGTGVFPSWGSYIAAYLATGAGQSFSTTLAQPHALSPWVGLGVMVASVAAGLVAAAVALDRRDA
ncbi:LysE family transporter [Nocardioides anomalus]|uniref:LysE family transporter n=1 Tax=Nocardioides anomalus TaxID=2712223 RepID=A0A6G6WFH7_9ACTN|nr:LysE family transporter [Nocardioides anomalus]QIG43913.1 LysE family transporter [Nocardioides anomalus]